MYTRARVSNVQCPISRGWLTIRDDPFRLPEAILSPRETAHFIA